MSQNFSATTPAAPAGNTNIVWQADGLGNLSGYVPTSFIYKVVSKTSTYSAVSGDDIWCTGTFTITLPVLTTTQRVKVSNRGTGTITIIPTSGTINGQSSLTIARQYSSCEFSGDGTNIGIE